jgi:hypothetical protein
MDKNVYECKIVTMEIEHTYKNKVMHPCSNLFHGFNL